MAEDKDTATPATQPTEENTTVPSVVTTPIATPAPTTAAKASTPVSTVPAAQTGVTTDSTTFPDTVITTTNSGLKNQPAQKPAVVEEKKGVSIRNRTNQKQLVDLEESLVTFFGLETKEFQMTVSEAKVAFEFWINNNILQIKN